MSESAVDRVSRALDLVPFILENPGIEISSLAKKFKINEKQVLADLELIFLCGLPGYTPYELIDLTFEDGLVTVIDPQVLDKPRQFNEIEAVVLVLGLSIMKNVINDSKRLESINNLQEKIAAKFSAIENISFTTSSKPKFYDLVSEAMSSRRSLNLTYSSISRDEITQRFVAPRSIYLAQGNFYFVALDRKSNQERHFRMDLIIDCELSDDLGSEEQTISEDTNLFDFRINTRNKYLTERYSELFTDISQQGDSYHARGRMNNREWLKRLVISNAPDIELFEPADLKKEIEERALRTLALYQ
jgi:proteasome accessory factor C